MHPVTRSELERTAAEWDASVAVDASIDPFCSGSAWSLAFHDAFEPEREIHRITADGAQVLLAESRRRSAPGLLEPLENMWGFSSPLVGPDAAGLLAEALQVVPRPVLLLGMPPSRGRFAPLAALLERGFQARILAATHRYVASLEGGVDGWLARRSSAFRRNLRQVLRRVEASGIRFRRVAAQDDVSYDDLYRTVLDVEARSWKGQSGRGADRDPMRRFYAGIWARLVERDDLRVLVAERDERAVGYLHGGLAGDRFRGLQFSFDESLRETGLGNALQYEMVRWLGESGIATYDLGGQSAYKARWAERDDELWSVLLHPRR